MNTHVGTSIVQMEPSILENLVKEVKETIAKDVVIAKPARRSFTAADLWNIRRKTVSAMTRIAR